MPGEEGGGRQAEQAGPQPRLDGVEAARRAVRRVRELTGLEPEGVTSLEPADGGGWRVGVEVVELQRIPDTTDVLAVYQVVLDGRGQLASYRRAQRYYRGRADDREA